jgi:putative phosphoesterase
MMRIAIFSDIHGNPIALDTVLNDIRVRGNVDGFFILGDLAAIGYDPIGALERVAALPNARIIRGNTDRYILTGERPAPSLENAQVDSRLVRKLVEVVSGFSWTQGAIATNGWHKWLDVLPLEMRATLPDGTRMLAVHASPGLDDGTGVHPGVSDTELQKLITDCAADLVLVGHTHWATDRRVGNVRVVNPGSVSNQFLPDAGASYALLDADLSGYHLEFYRVEYDRARVIAETRRVNHPAGDYIVRYMRGEIRPEWMENKIREIES